MLQNDLKLFRWYEVMLFMDFDIGKCFEMMLKRLHNQINFIYKIKGKSIQECNNVKYLGILFDKKLILNIHIDTVSCKALKMLGFIQRNSQDLPTGTFKLLYRALVRSIVEYCCPTWTLEYRTHIVQLERVQNKFLRIVYTNEST